MLATHNNGRAQFSFAPTLRNAAWYPGKVCMYLWQHPAQQLKLARRPVNQIRIQAVLAKLLHQRVLRGAWIRCSVRANAP
jgi:hypothetical protein